MRRANDLSGTRAEPLGRRAIARLPRAVRLGAGALVATLGLGGAAVALADPAASFSISDERPARGQTVTLTATAECLAPVSCTWSGDDGLSASGREVTHAYSSLGTKQVTLTVDDPAEGSGDPEVVTRTVEVVNRAPEVSFDYEATNLDVAFTARATDADGDPLTYRWDFGDGSPASDADRLADPTHTYGAAGSYDVTLEVSDGHDTSRHSASVTVVAANAAPTAAFGVSTDGLTARFDATSSSDPDGDELTYAWTFGDGTAAAGASVSHTFLTSDTYAVALEVSDGRGGEHTVTRQLLVNRPPAAAISVSTSSVVVGRPVTFTSASTDPDGDALRLAWDIDGEPAAGGEKTPAITRSFDTPGSHSVRLRVVDDHGGTDSATVTVEAANLAPTVSIVASPSTVLTGEPISFTAGGEDPDGGPLHFAWDLDADGFDDGSGPSIGPLAFEVPGTRSIRVMAADGEGEPVVEELSVVIGNRGPSADFDWAPATVERRQPVTFTSRATDPEGLDLAEQSWDLDGDGAYDDAFGPTATTSFRKGGTHDVGLRVVDAHGGIAEVRIPIVLGNRPPTASFTVSPEQPGVGDTVELASTSVDPDGEELQSTWDLDGDGEYDDAAGPGARVLVERTGTVSVGLRVVDDEGGVDISRRDIAVLDRGNEPAPVAQKPAPRMLSPFPSVRIAGSLTRRGARFRVVSVSAPKGARVTWACAARRCRAGGRVGTGRALRIRALQREFPAGATFEVRVTRRGWIGKYTRVKVLSKRGPARRDLCLAAGSKRPTACPA